MDKMTEGQEQHLDLIKAVFCELVDTKYRKGQAEHGGNLYDAPPAVLVGLAIEEAVDQVVYLLTLRDAVNRGRDVR